MYYIRTDANEKIGSGHVMRCLAIAKAMKVKGIECKFITADNKSDKLLSTNGFSSIHLNTSWNDMESEIPIMTKLIKELNINNLVIDSYFVTQRYFECLKQYTRIIYIDDIDQFLYPVDILINYNIYAENHLYKDKYINKSKPTKLLLGCDYVPLRQEFCNRSPVIKSNITDILITTGGADFENVGIKLIQHLQLCERFSSLNFHLVVGALNTHKNELNEISHKYSNIILHNNVNNMSDIMLSCDVAISAGGFTLYELCACGIPTISYSIADNQLDGVYEFQRQGIIFYAGDMRDDYIKCLNRIQVLISQLITNYDLRIHLSNRMQKLVDGKGTDRIIEQL